MSKKTMEDATVSKLTMHDPTDVAIKKLNIKSISKENEDLRHWVLRGETLGVAVMCVPVGNVIEERVFDADQLYFATKGEGRIVIDTHSIAMEKGDMVLVPAHQKHTLIADDEEDLKLVLIEPVLHDRHPIPFKGASDDERPIIGDHN